MLNRRKLLATAGLAATGLVGATACLKSPPSARNGAVQPAVQSYAAAPAPAPPAPAAPAPKPGAAAPAPTTTSHAGMAMTPNPATSALTKADEMDKHHEAGIKAFPAKTALYGNQRLPFTHGRRRQGVRGHRLEGSSGRSSRASWSTPSPTTAWSPVRRSA